MYQRLVPGTLALCALLLAACGGGGGEGGGGPASPVATAASPSLAELCMQDPRYCLEPSRTEGTVLYGNWNELIKDALTRDFPGCEADCGRWFPPRPQHDEDPDDTVPPRDIPFRSPFGQMATFDPATDRWAATWSGDARGSRHSDPDDAGPAGKAWQGTFNLEIESGEWSTVKMWAENLFYRQAADPDMPTTVAVDDDEIPNSESDAWTATLSTAVDQKGYFSGDELHGQFLPPGSGETIPPSAIGHIHDDDHTGVFEVEHDE